MAPRRRFKGMPRPRGPPASIAQKYAPPHRQMCVLGKRQCERDAKEQEHPRRERSGPRHHVFIVSNAEERLVLSCYRGKNLG